MTTERSVSAAEITREGDEISALREELRAIKDTIDDGLVIIDEDNRVISLNPGAERISRSRANLRLPRGGSDWPAFQNDNARR